jgi:short-subunit dehydrogenase
MSIIAIAYMLQSSAVYINFLYVNMTIFFSTLGRIINCTSVKGRVSLPRISVYGITKYGGENFSDCLRLEMRKFGVKVVIIEPGEFGGVTGILRGNNVGQIM